jgi:hypothetical protein
MSKALLIVILLLSGKLLSAQLTYNNLQVDYDSALAYKNLKIIPIRPKGGFGTQTRLLYDYSDIVSLGQAIQHGYVTVSERGTASTENVHWLRINNKSNKKIFIGSGEMIMGGRQDRMVSRDTVMAPNGRDQYVPVMCVEEERWSDKEKKFEYNNYANPMLRKVLDQSKNQVVIWKEVSDQLMNSGIKSPSLAYGGRRLDKKFGLQEDDYFKYFFNKFKNTDSTIVGFVCMSGDKVIGSDVFAGTNLFYGELGPMLYGYIEQAIAYGKQPVTVSDEKVKSYLDPILTDEQGQLEYLKKNGKVYKYNGKVIHITGFGQ